MNNEIIWKTDSGFINNNYSYSGYINDIRSGSLCVLNDGKIWSLQIPVAEIKLRGWNRNDLIEEAQVLYDKFVERHK